MKLFFIFVVVVSCISRGSSVDMANAINSKLQLEDLNTDVLLEIFDYLELESLISLADLNHRFRELVIRRYIILKYRFHEKIIKISFKPIGDAIIFNDDYGSIGIYGPNLTSSVVRIFGNLISRIAVYPEPYKGDLSYSMSTVANINKYCSKSLTELRINKFEENLFQQWKKPFENVSTIYIEDGYWNCEHTNTNLSEIFPSLRRFEMRLMFYSSSKCIDFHFPNLEHIQLPVLSKTYENIFDLNPQLRSIHLAGANNFKVLRAANEKLIKLEAIEISDMYWEAFNDPKDNETIHFKNVRRFCIESTQFEPIFIPFAFDQLEEVELKSTSAMNRKWLEFVGKQQKLKNLTILIVPLNLQQWKIIIEKIPELEVIETVWNDGGSGGIAGIMATKTKLKKVILHETTIEKCNDFKGIIDPQWQFDGEIRGEKHEATFINNENNNF